MQQRVIWAFLIPFALWATACNRSGLPPVTAAPRATPPEGWIEVDLSQYGILCHMPGYTRLEKDDPTLVFAGEHYVCETPNAVYVISVAKDDAETPGGLTEEELKEELETQGAKVSDIRPLQIQGLQAMEARYSLRLEENPDLVLHVIERLCKRGPAHYAFTVYGTDEDVYEARDTVAFFANIRLIN